MSIWYVRPDASHSGTRNGQSYATAWGGWSAIVWGTGGVVGGDTLYVCGAHYSSSTLSIGAHGASGSVVTISGGYADDPGSITFAGSVFFNFNRGYTTVASLAITGDTSNCIYVNGVLAEVTIDDCTLSGGTGAAIINISGGNGNSYTGLTISNNDCIGGSGYSLGSAINWIVVASGTPVNSLNRVTISGNTFTGCSSSRSVVHLRIEDGANASSNMADVIVDSNTFDDCVGVAIEVYGPSVYGRNTGIRIIDNVIRNQSPVGILGGGMSISGFGPSLTSSFGPNIIARNKGYVVRGPSGLVNVFYGTYIIYNNYGEDLSTHTIDGNGLLFDHGCDNCVAYGNEFKRLTGNPGVPNSGCGIMVLDATKIRAYGNIFDGCLKGLYIGNKSAGQSSDIHNNTFLNCSETGLDVLSTADMTANLARNNLFTTTRSVPSVSVASGTFSGESTNCYHGFASASGHTLDASDIDDAPDLDALNTPQAAAVKDGGLRLGGVDFYGKEFAAAIGAVMSHPAKSVTTRSVATREVTARALTPRRAISAK